MKNQEILDDDQLNNGKKVIDKRTEKPCQRAFIYSIIMLIIGYGIAFFEYRNTLLDTNFSFYFTLSTTVIFLCTVVSFILESFWFLVRKFKNKKSGVITLIDPFWFQIIEGTFAIWILFSLLKIIRQIVF